MNVITRRIRRLLGMKVSPAYPPIKRSYDELYRMHHVLHVLSVQAHSMRCEELLSDDDWNNLRGLSNALCRAEKVINKMIELEG